MRRLVLLSVLCVVGVAGSARAQSAPNVGPNDSFAWDIAAPDIAAARGYVYKYYLDGAVTGSVWANVTCSGTASPFSCQARTPTFANGPHSLTLSAASAAGESAQSVPFGFVSGNPPGIPNNIRTVKGAATTADK